MLPPKPLLALLILLLATVPAPAQNPPAVPVVTVTVTKAPLVRELPLTGTITPRRQARLSSRTSGLLHKLHVDAGDRVEAGQVLAELDPALAQLAVDRVQVEMRQAEVELAEARRLLEEVQDLAKVGGYSKSEAQTRETNVRLRTATLERLDVQLKEQKEILQRHQLIAPYSGVITRKVAEEGEWLQTGVAVVELVETKGVRLDVQVPQEHHQKISGDTPVAIALDSQPGKSWPGKVTALVPVKDPTSRTFLVRVESEAAAAHMAPGMSARAIFSIASGEPRLAVPRDAVVRSADGTTRVWVVVESGGKRVAAPRPVRLRSGLTPLVEVIEGLKEGEEVVVRGNETLREGQEVQQPSQATTP